VLCDALRQYSIFIPSEQRPEVRKRAYEVLKPFINDPDISDRKKAKYAAALRIYVAAVTENTTDELELERLRRLLQEAMSIIKALAEKNPDGYSNELASCYYDYGDFLRDKTDESPEWYYLEAFCHYKKRLLIDERNTVFFYALSAGRVANYYMSIGLDILAYEFYERQIWGKERLCDPDMGRSQRSKAGYQYDIGTIFLNKLSRKREAALAFQKSIELYSTLPTINDDDRMWIGYANDYLDENDLRKYLVE
jgi:tetratricopeptide (TPR) repeat protein